MDWSGMNHLVYKSKARTIWVERNSGPSYKLVSSLKRNFSLVHDAFVLTYSLWLIRRHIWRIKSYHNFFQIKLKQWNRVEAVWWMYVMRWWLRSIFFCILLHSFWLSFLQWSLTICLFPSYVCFCYRRSKIKLISFTIWECLLYSED